MLFNLLVLLVVLLLTAYLATQGVLSATLALVSGAFASILAMGLFEPLQGTVEGRWPGLARGVTYLAIYAVTFGVLRFGADFLIRKNVKLADKRIDSLAGAVVGFFAALVIVGSCVLGLEMFPVHTTILGFGGDQEYLTDARMQGGEQGQVVPDDGISMWPQRFALALWNGSSGRSLGGNKQFGAVHPDLPMESYGYRNVVEYGSIPTISQELLDTSKFKAECYVSDAPDLLKKCSITQAGKQALVVRIRVKKGISTPAITYDADNYFRITPTQLRLVTDRDQHYPIGHLRNQSSAKVDSPAYTFEATPLDAGHLIDDYVADTVIEDWVFLIDRGELPRFLEVKELARADFPEKISSNPFTPLAAAEYPHREYRKNHRSIEVTLWGDDAGTQALKDVELYLLPVAAMIGGENQDRDIRSAFDAAGHKLESAKDKEDPWSEAFGKPGVPPWQTYKTSFNIVSNANTLTVIRWEELMPVLMLGTTTPNGAQNLNDGPSNFQKSIVPLLKDARVTAKTDDKGKLEMKDVAPGDYCVIGASKTESGAFCVWAKSIKVEPSTPTDSKPESLELKANSAVFTLTPAK